MPSNPLGEAMPTAPRADNIRVKIQRARKNVDEAAAFIKSYLDKKPFTVSYKRDPATRRLIYYVSSVEEPDPELSGIVGDALHNLRSALDHIAYQLVMIGTGQTPSRRVYFPIWDSQAKYESKGRRQIEGARPEAITAVDGIRPYKGGNDRLWQLQKLNNVDKHRLLIMVGSALSGVNIAETLYRGMRETLLEQGMDRLLEAFRSSEMPPLFLRPGDNLFPLKPDAELFVDGPDAEPSERVTFRFEVSFGEPQVVDGEPIVPTLQELVKVVEGVLDQLAPHL